MTAHTVLVVEDEKDIRQLLAFSFKNEGFEVLEADNGNRALEMATAKQPDVILLDIMLPGLDGLGVCRALQRDARTESIPVIMLTAKGEEVDRIVGFELGAMDYVVKPFSMRELILRVRAVLRRNVTAPEVASLHCGEIRLNTASHAVQVHDKPIELTFTEFRLLEDLMRNQGRVRSREQLLDSVWGYSFEGYGRTVDTHVRRLRSKLGDEAERIETVRGVGYRAKE